MLFWYAGDYWFVLLLGENLSIHAENYDDYWMSYYTKSPSLDLINQPL